ncbi:MAG: serine/threonine protein kinase [Gemmatimonadaceae bacterium]|nr:serine/threonine protein kinase [Gemmatimonadaceae bacterium]
MNAIETLRSALADRYAIEREVGRGGMATVYLARDLKHARNVAIKVLDPELGAVLGVERFLAEIRVTANLQHPHLLPLFDSGEAGGLLFYVMPFIEGESLRARLDRERQLSVEEAIRIGTALADALDFAHGHGVIHRDLKPENILLQAGHPVIADFGIALAVSNAGGSRVTQTGLSLGTPQYMSPEQAMGERTLDARSDQYSLAAVIYELLTGEPPHTGPTPQVVLSRLLTESPRSVRTTRAAVALSTDAALTRALSKAPADRFASVRAFADALRESARPAEDRPASRRGLAVLAGVTLIAVISALAWFARPRAAVLDPQTIALLPATTTGADAAAMALRFSDAVVQSTATLGWVTVKSAAAPAASDAAAAEEARRAGAAVAVVPVIRSAGSALELGVRVLDAKTGAVVHQAVTATLPVSATTVEVQRAAEPVTVAVGFITARELGAIALPSGRMPTLDAFRQYSEIVTRFRNTFGFDGRLETMAGLGRVVRADTAFLQGRLWLGFAWGWGGAFGRTRNGAARSDSLASWIREAEASGSPYERALARLAKSYQGEISEDGVAEIRAFLKLSPPSPLRRILMIALADLNRPREAIAEGRALLATQEAADSLDAGRRATLLLNLSALYHFVGEDDSALVMAREARALRPTDLATISSELYVLAAMGRVDDLQRALPEAANGSSTTDLFAFPGNTFLTVANEFAAHGHPEASRAIAERGARWFDDHAAETERDMNAVVRRAITYDLVGRTRDAVTVLRAAIVRDTANDQRLHGLLGRMLLTVGDTAGADREVAWLNALPLSLTQGAVTYELAAIEVRRGRDHWDRAIELAERAMVQGQGFSIRRRLHYFADWIPLRDYPGFQRMITPRG